MALSAVPVRMVHVSVTGGYTTSAMIDMAYYADLGENPARQISELNRSYGNMIESAKKLFYDEVGNSKKNVASSVYFEMGKLFLDFIISIRDKFEIVNYTAALSRDFGLSQGYITDLLAIAKSFDIKEIVDTVPFTHYRMLKRKQNALERIGCFKREKKRLSDMGNAGRLPTRELYKKELADMVRNDQTQSEYIQKHIDNADF